MFTDWDAHIVLAMRNLSGGSWEDWEDQLTMPRLEALMKDLNTNPPLYITMPAAFGIKVQKQGTIDDFISSFPSGAIG